VSAPYPVNVAVEWLALHLLICAILSSNLGHDIYFRVIICTWKFQNCPLRKLGYVLTYSLLMLSLQCCDKLHSLVETDSVKAGSFI